MYSMYEEPFCVDAFTEGRRIKAVFSFSELLEMELEEEQGWRELFKRKLFTFYNSKAVKDRLSAWCLLANFFVNITFKDIAAKKEFRAQKEAQHAVCLSVCLSESSIRRERGQRYPWICRGSVCLSVCLAVTAAGVQSPSESFVIYILSFIVAVKQNHLSVGLFSIHD